VLFSERTCGSGEDGDSKGEPGEDSEEGTEYLNILCIHFIIYSFQKRTTYKIKTNTTKKLRV
jgi:hypothetical protein